ncbi:MAG: hypothetical protein AB2693_22130 [Candidatus Thiodiazotropha sp.]
MQRDISSVITPIDFDSKREVEGKVGAVNRDVEKSTGQQEKRPMLPPD